MTAKIYSFAWSANTEALYRATLSGLSAALQDIGLVKTPDTGQINLATITVPGPGITNSYEIFRFADTLQATAPIFMKLEYGQSSSAGGGIWIYATFGTGTDNAGTLIGKVGARTLMNNSSGGSTVAKTTYLAMGPGYFTGIFGADQNNTIYPVGVMVIERTLNPDGAYNSAGFMTALQNHTGFSAYQVIPHGTPPVPGRQSYLPIVLPHFAGTNPFTSYADGTDVGFFSVASATPRPHSAHTVCLGCTQSDIGRYTTFQISLYGQIRTFIAMGTSATNTCIAGSDAGPVQAGNSSWAIRHD